MQRPEPTIARATGPEEVAACLVIRRAVFVEEQSVPVEIEMDEFDTTAIHYLARVDGEPAATARLRLLPPVAKVQRVAVLREHRRRGVGAALMRAIAEEVAREREGIDTLTLGSQLAAVPFYASLGYAPHGEKFMDADIPHIEMRRPVDRPRVS